MAGTIHQVSYVSFALCVAGLISLWYPVCRSYRTIPLALGWRMWKLQSKSWRGVALTSSLYLALFYVLKATVWPALDKWLPPIPLCFVLAGVVSFVGYSCLPPAVLFLTTSQPEQRTLAVQMGRAIRPYRVVYLLSHDMTVGVYDAEDFSDDNLRTPDDVDWRHVVHPLMDMVRIVLIDTRVASPAVVEESVRMLAPERVAKAIFMTKATGEAPALEQAVSKGDVKPDAADKALKVREDEAVRFMKRLLR